MNSYHVGVGDLLLLRLFFVSRSASAIWEELLQSSEGSVGLRLLLVEPLPCKHLPVDLHLNQQEKKERAKRFWLVLQLCS